MKTLDFDFDLPDEFIAQIPVEPRDQSRLLVLDRKTGQLEHRIFYQLDEYLRAGDLLVLNQTRVIPARLFARKASGGRVEILLLRKEDDLTWQALVGGKGLRAGRRLEVENGPGCEIVAELDGSHRKIKFDEAIEPFFPATGHVPLPPYIHTELKDPDRYQTVYAQEPGSAAAPTAGLHFTKELISRLGSRGIETADVILHVGLDTFAPVTEADPAEHVIHTEWCEIREETCRKINSARRNGGRIVAVGTTSVRTLETAARHSVITHRDSPLRPFVGDTNLFILPGYEFRVVDAMITNFHLPKSTLIMLVSAFAGREKIFHAYEVAKQEKYRFFSFGDAMLIL